MKRIRAEEQQGLHIEVGKVYRRLIGLNSGRFATVTEEDEYGVRYTYLDNQTSNYMNRDAFSQCFTLAIHGAFGELS